MRKLLLPLAAVFLGLPGLAAEQPPPPGDLAVTEAVERRLRMHEAVPEARIDVATHEGVVTLSGTVDRLNAKFAAEDVAEEVLGVLGVVNRIEVVPPPRGDGAIRGDVIAALIAEPGVDSVDVNVEVEDRVVTLYGEMATYVERYLAEQTAQNVAGVAAVVNRLTYDIVADRPDNVIAQDIRDRLRADASIASRLLTVAVEDGEVTLAGSVRSAGEKRRAERQAWAVPGVRSVENYLDVQWWRAEEMRDWEEPWTDQRMRGEIENRLRESTRLDAGDIHITVKEGQAMLRGEVDNLQQRRLAEELARNVLGIREVRNQLHVRAPLTRDDATMAQEIRSNLQRNPYVRLYDIAVEVDHGRAILRGEVDTWHMKRQATEAAARVDGVVAIENNLDVDYRPPARTDREIQEDIEHNLWWNPRVDSEDVHVEVESGVATLSGTVRDWGQAQAAVENAREAGATSVVNNLQVTDAPRTP